MSQSLVLDRIQAYEELADSKIDVSKKHNWVYNTRMFYRVTFKISRQMHKKRKTWLTNKRANEYAQSMSQLFELIARYNLKHIYKFAQFDVELMQYEKITEDDIEQILKSEDKNAIFQVV